MKTIVMGVVAACAAAGGASAQNFDIRLSLDFGGLNATDLAAAEAAFVSAEQTWESIINGYRPDIATQIDGFDGPLIFGTIEPIDGPGNILGSAGPDFAFFLDVAVVTTEGSMRFDSADVSALLASGAFEAVILHEMAHVLGIGTLWDPALNDLSDCRVNGDPSYFGPAGLQGAQDVFMVFTDDIVELDGGGGTRCGHWDEGLFDNELMTGFLNGGVNNPITDLTVGGLTDLGFDTTPMPTEPCSVADVAEPFGVLDLTDVDSFILGFFGGDPVSDIAPPFGVFDLADIDTFIIAFFAGCVEGNGQGRRGVVPLYQCGVSFGVNGGAGRSELRLFEPKAGHGLK